MNISTIRTLSSRSNIYDFLKDDSYEYLLLILALILFLNNDDEYLDYFLNTFLFIPESQRNNQIIKKEIITSFKKLNKQEKEQIEKITENLNKNNNNTISIKNLIDNYDDYKKITIIMFIIFTKKNLFYNDYKNFIYTDKPYSIIIRDLLLSIYGRSKTSSKLFYTKYHNILSIIYYKCYLFNLLSNIILNEEKKNKIFNGIFFNLNELMETLPDFETIEFYLKTHHINPISNLRNKIIDLLECLWIFFRNKKYNINDNHSLEIFSLFYSSKIKKIQHFYHLNINKLIDFLILTINDFYINMIYRFREINEINQKDLNFVKGILELVIIIIKDNDYSKNKYRELYKTIDDKKQSLNWIFYYTISSILTVKLNNIKRDYIIRIIEKDFISKIKGSPTLRQNFRRSISKSYENIDVDEDKDNELKMLFVDIIKEAYKNNRINIDLLNSIIINLNRS